MFPDFIRETEIYEYILQEGREKGRELVRQEELKRLRQMLIALVQGRSTELVPLAHKRAEEIDDIEKLYALVLKVGTTQSAEDVRRYHEEVEDK